MAAKEEIAPAVAAPKKGKKLLLIVVTLGVVVLLAAVLVLWLLFSGVGREDGDEDEDAQEVASGTAGTPTISVALDPFTVNLARTSQNSDRTAASDKDQEQQTNLAQIDDGDRYMQATISLEVDSLDADAAIKGRMPRIRNNVILIMSGKTAAELMTREGKAALAKEIKDDINRIINPPKKGKKATGPVVDVLFSSFIIQ
jgi:flagellar FliL protein